MFPGWLMMLRITEANVYANKLYRDLLVDSSYNKLIRPVRNHSDILTVKLGLRLSQLIGIVCTYKP